MPSKRRRLQPQRGRGGERHLRWDSALKRDHSDREERCRSQLQRRHQRERLQVERNVENGGNDRFCDDRQAGRLGAREEAAPARPHPALAPAPERALAEGRAGRRERPCRTAAPTDRRADHQGCRPLPRQGRNLGRNQRAARDLRRRLRQRGHCSDAEEHLLHNAWRGLHRKRLPPRTQGRPEGQTVPQRAALGCTDRRPEERCAAGAGGAAEEGPRANRRRRHSSPRDARHEQPLVPFDDRFAEALHRRARQARREG